MAPRLKVAPGQLLEGRFLVLEQIAQGGMSTVFKAADLAHCNALVAVKVPLAQYSSGVGSWSMFQREAEIGGRLEHPNIVRFTELSQPAQRSYVVTEYLSGQSLGTLVGEGRRLLEPDALRIASQVCEAVDYLHGRGIVHYDLKPDNVIVGDDGRIVLIDFGMAHRAVTGRFSFGATAPPFASANYVAPEQLQRHRGQRSVDIYAIGAMLYEMLTGRAPFEHDDPFVIASARQIGDPPAPRAVQPSISPQAEEIVLRALRRNPKQRYRTAGELKAELDAPAAVRVSGLARHLVPVTRWRKAVRAARFVALVAIAPIAVLILSFRVLWWYLERRP